MVIANPITQPRTHLWTREEFHQMGDLGWFVDKYVELIDGEIVEMPPPGPLHCISTDRVAAMLRKWFPTGHWVRIQMPLNPAPYSEPSPDDALVQGERDTHTTTPTTALLVVEVSDSTLAYDRNIKGSLYAVAGIADYWIVNLVDRQLEIRRNAVPDPAQPYRHRYADLVILKPGDYATPLAAPHAKMAVADLLP
jgi:Uma2 family endonuclease